MAGLALEPGLHLRQAVLVGQGAAGDFGECAVAAGQDGEHVDDLLVPDRHPVRRRQHRHEIRVRVRGAAPWRAAM